MRSTAMRSSASTGSETVCATAVADAIATTGMPLSVTSCGSLLNVHAAPGVRTPAQAEAAAHTDLARCLHLGLINRGVFAAHRGELCISTPMTEETVDRVAAAVGQVLAEAAAAERAG